jgi:hypothetical protein
MVYVEVAMTTYYKIRYKDNPELFIKGTPAYQSSDKTGRIFQSLGQLRTFLTSVMNNDSWYARKGEPSRNRVADWEVVELEMVVKEVKGVHEVITAKRLKELIMK